MSTNEHVKVLAAALDGREYPFDLTREEAAAAKAQGLVVVFGASDDLMEFRGAIHDELGAYEGATAYLTDAGLVANDCESDECPHFKRAQQSARTIRALWGDEGVSWRYETDIPHATFRVVEEGETYCIGIVFRLADAAIAALNPWQPIETATGDER